MTESKSDEELVDEMIMQNRVYDVNHSATSRFKADKLQDKLLSNLNRLDEVEKENKKWKEMYAGIMADKHILIVENENLKCCGNCRINCNCESFFRGWHKYCDQWQSDSMTREERE
jgi:hypothetical protein